jgi:hypothetical protein
MVVFAACGSEPGASPRLIEGLWTGNNTNGFPPDALLSIKLNTNGQGAVMSVGLVGIPGTFTYSLSQGRIICFTNDSPQLTGSLRYDARADMLIYQESPRVAASLREHHGPVHLLRDTNEVRDVVLGSVIGATNYTEVMSRLGAVFGTLTNRLGVVLDRPAAPMHNRAQPDGAANGSQPIRSETNSTSSAAGSRR